MDMQSIVLLSMLELYKKMDILTQTLAQEALIGLGITNYALYGIPTSEEEFFKFVHPVKGIDQTGTVVGFSTNEYPFTYNEFNEKYNEARSSYEAKEYQRLRAKEYPDFKEYLDGIVKGDTDQIQAYIDSCNAVKAKYPKPIVGIASTSNVGVATT